MTAEEIKRILGLEPHPEEGGFFCETYRSQNVISEDALPPGYSGARSLGTAIFYLLTPDTFSALHRLRGDEIFHFYLGDPVEMLQLRPGGSGELVMLGSDLAAGMRLQVVVPGGVWQGSRLRPGGRFALMGTTVTPGFDFADFETGSREELVSRYPEFADGITTLTR